VAHPPPSPFLCLSATDAQELGGPFVVSKRATTPIADKPQQPPPFHLDGARLRRFDQPTLTRSMPSCGIPPLQN
jgi:hypothetical protein